MSNFIYKSICCEAKLDYSKVGKLYCKDCDKECLEVTERIPSSLAINVIPATDCIHLRYDDNKIIQEYAADRKKREDIIKSLTEPPKNLKPRNSLL